MFLKACIFALTFMTLLRVGWLLWCWLCRDVDNIVKDALDEKA